MQDSTLAATITRLGRAWDARQITLAQAVAQLQAADPTLTKQGATGQIKAWASAAFRYQARLHTPALGARRVDSAALRCEPIIVRSPAAGDAA
jgi:hypothetical protein